MTSGATAGGGGVAGVVLAAGGGRRMGRAKALVAVAGVPLVERATATLIDGGCVPVGVVVGSSGEAAAALLTDRPDVTVVTNDDWRSGMASSVKRALRWAGQVDPPVAAVVVLPVDTPGIGPAVVRRLIAAWSTGDPRRAAVATYDGAPRNPVVLPAAAWDRVAAMVQGDTGARQWLRDNPGAVTAVDCTDLGDPADLDTPDDLARWNGRPDAPAATGPTGEPHGT